MQAAKAFNEQLEAQDLSPETRTRITKLTEEKKSALQQCNKIRHELELFKREGNKRGSGVSFMFVIIIGLLGMFMGYMMKKLNIILVEGGRLLQEKSLKCSSSDSQLGPPTTEGIVPREGFVSCALPRASMP
ncbi:vesicle-associated protein 1-2-like [Gossypium australe]|uniref:Vesicle-associated protein 1-2-like n=1 Tax=Gossypium australe TaxID=47621 RepID=A0A5B6UHX9_9ROSI|nr:vesicle-associated protein 1-2-like [Gossypium australe]